MTELTEKDLAKREEQYEKAVMKSSKNPIKKGTKLTQSVKTTKQSSLDSEDEDEKDAFEMFNPFGGKYK